MKLISLVLLLVPILSFAAPTVELPAGAEQRILSRTTIDGVVTPKLLEIVKCAAAIPGEECPPVETVYLKSYGKAHGGNHTSAAKVPGAYAQCVTCHISGEESGSIVNADYSFCPAKEAVIFANPAIMQALGLRVPVMLGEMLPLATGGYFRDEILDQDIVCGGDLGCYKKGEVPLCLDCHHHDGDPEDAGLSSRDVHNGCLDCHTRVASGSLRPGIKDALENIIGD